MHEREMEASMIMAKRLRSLQTIGWSTFFKSGVGTTAFDWRHPAQDMGLYDGDLGDWERSTTKWVLRQDGKIRIKGTPWV